MMIPFISRALADATITVSPTLPGMPAGVVTDPTTYITGFYQLALTFAGILAFGAIVYGGIKYAVGRGNPSSESEGKSWITNALLGMLLLVGAYIILFTINPQLVTLQLPELSALSGTAPAGTTPPGSTGAAGCANGSCQSLSGNGFSCKPASQQPGGVESCSAAQGMVDTLKCLRQNGAPGITVTEAIPPTVYHGLPCHNSGCCVDVSVNSGNCNDIQALMNAMSACHTSALNEYTRCGGRTYNTTTKPNIHINSASGGGC